MTEDNVKQAELQVRHWEASHHFLHKMFTSPTVAAAIIALVGTGLTLYVNHENTKFERLDSSASEKMKHENAVIIEVLRHGNDQQLDSRLEKLVHLGFLQSKWVGR
jgi:hypothetical protein